MNLVNGFFNAVGEIAEGVARQTVREGVRELNRQQMVSNALRIAGFILIGFGVLTESFLGFGVGIGLFLCAFIRSNHLSSTEAQLHVIAKGVGLELWGSFGTDLLFRTPVIIRS